MAKPTQQPIGGLGLLLDRVAASLLKEFDEAIAPWEIRNLHLGILSTIERYGPLPQIRIGEFLGIERQTMANLVDDLESLGFVERRRVASDRRVWAVALTDKGMRSRSEAAAAGVVKGKSLFSRLSRSEAALLGDLLNKLATGGRYPNLFVPPIIDGETM
jgi:DNA-binding MarR family transcriptional regulator